jgi:acyl transferase domain-containing protein
MNEGEERDMNSNTGGDIAIIGMSCVYAGARNLRQYWENILNKVDAIRDAPDDWAPGRRFGPPDEEGGRPNPVRGGFLADLAEFRPTDYGIPPNSVDGASPDHFIAIRLAYEALADAGYGDPARLKPFRERMAVVLGHGEYINRGHSSVLQHSLMLDTFLGLLKRLHPEHTDEELADMRALLKASLPPLHADNAPGLVPNVVSGRIANRLDLMGPSYVIDGACASSLLAVDAASRDLQMGRCDMAMVGGVHCSTTPPIIDIFSKLKGLSSQGQIRPFDKNSDGTLLGEGAGMMVLKRREDAERDGDRIYALIKGVGVASDGRALGLLAPRPEGEELAIRRAYESAGVDPATVELVEGHGTATLVGDATELEVLNRVFGNRTGDMPNCALGSVKSMIGHTIPASGMASLIKMALSLYYKILPPTIHCEEPSPKLRAEQSNLYINTETRPWIHGSRATPRRAGVNAFGFGGINAHAVLEEASDESPALSLHQTWDSELFVITGDDRQGVVSGIARLRELVVASGPELVLKDLAWAENSKRALKPLRLCIVASSAEDLRAKLDRTAKRLGEKRAERIRDKDGVYWFEKPLMHSGKLAFVFPGEGSQYLNMMADLCLHFPEVRKMFDLMDRTFEGHERGYLPSQVIVPPPGSAANKRLFSMDVGPEAVFCANQAIFALLEKLDVRADAMMGHSTGEHSALVCSGMARIADDEEWSRCVRTVNAAFEGLKAGVGIPERELLAIGGADYAVISSLVSADPDLYIALDNCPNQVVLCGTNEALSKVLKRLESTGAICQRLPFARAYHTPLFDAFAQELRGYFGSVRIGTPDVPLYSCVTADRFPDDVAQVREIGAVGWARQVRFRETIQRMYEDGARIFVEVGPRGNLRSFIDDILRGKPYAAISSNVEHRSGISQLHHLLGELIAHGVSVRLDHLYENRDPQPVGLAKPEKPAMKIQLGMKQMQLPEKFRLAHQTMNGAPRPLPVAPAAKTFVPEPQPVPAFAAALPAAPAVPAAAVTGRAAVLQQHFNTMTRFLEVQQQVMGTLLAQRPMPARAPTPGLGEDPTQGLPFISEVLELEPGKRVRAIHRFRQEPLYEHHALGRDVSEADPALVGLPIVPLTVSVEILAEGAALLEPGRIVIGMRNMRSQRWIMMDAAPPVIELVAERIQPGVVQVQMREADTGRPFRPVWMEAQVLFGDAWPAAEPALPFHLTNPHISKWVPNSLYPFGMFHGPLLRGVISVGNTAVDGASAAMEILPHDALLSGRKNPRFVLDPVTLDVVGQLTSFWSQEELDPACDFFPYTFESLKCFGAMPPVGTRVEGRILVREVTDKKVRCDLEVLDLSGSVLYRIENWEDRRFPQWRDLWSFRISPLNAYLSVPADDLIEPHVGQGPLACCRLDRFPPGYLEASFCVWQKMLGLLSLSRRERESFYAIQSDTARSEWLIDRFAAKDAVRMLVKKVTGVSLFPADIEISGDVRHMPKVEGSWSATLGVKPAVVVGRYSGAAVAVAGLDPEQVARVVSDFNPAGFNPA